MFKVFWSRWRKAAKSREEGLRKELLQAETRTCAEAKKAVAYCELCIADYEDWFEHNEAKWLRWQRVVIVGSVAATLAGVITLPDDWLNSWPKWVSSFGW